MAEPLKNHLGRDVPSRIATDIAKVYPTFPAKEFVRRSLEGFDDLELTQRARQIARAMGEALPTDRCRAVRILTASLGPENGAPGLTGMEAFFYLPHVFFVAEFGLSCFDESMEAQYELTKRFTAEFSIRVFIEEEPERTFSILEQWTSDPSPHVRRLVSEGTRSRLPWAPRLRSVQEDPGRVLDLLERLKDDPEEYVRRSVANNLNDLSKDHPEAVAETAERWWIDGDGPRRRLVRHALRTLIKAGNPEALSVLGYGAGSPARVIATTCEPATVAIGEKVRVQTTVENPSSEETGALVDIRVHFVKADGSTRPKVFKGAERLLGAGETAIVRKTVSVAQHSTRKHHPGLHRVEVLLNGTAYPGAEFDLVPESRREGV
jgi:3-methyladenine DNA glycosylase AlkC